MEQLSDATKADPVLLSESIKFRAWRLAVIFLRPSFAQLGRLWRREGERREICFISNVRTIRKPSICRRSCKLVCLR